MRARFALFACGLVTCALSCTLPVGAPCCAEDGDCDDGARCFEGRCASSCDDDSQCDEGEACDTAVAGVCRAQRSDDGCVARTAADGEGAGP